MNEKLRGTRYGTTALFVIRKIDIDSSTEDFFHVQFGTLLSKNDD